MSRKIEPVTVFFSVLKLAVLLVVLKAILQAVGFPGYIPVADELYNFVINSLLAIGGNPNILPHHLN